jgi:hypothetical protein
VTHEDYRILFENSSEAPAPAVVTIDDAMDVDLPPPPPLAAAPESESGPSLGRGRRLGGSSGKSRLLAASAALMQE